NPGLVVSPDPIGLAKFAGNVTYGTTTNVQVFVVVTPPAVHTSVAVLVELGAKNGFAGMVAVVTPPDFAPVTGAPPFKLNVAEVTCVVPSVTFATTAVSGVTAASLGWGLTETYAAR